MHSVGVHRFLTRGPGDVAGLVAAIAAGEVVAEHIVAVIGKTEGNGCVNDYTREYAGHALAHCLAGVLGIAPDDVARRIAFVMSGGTEGVLSPHITVFTRQPSTSAAPPRQKRLALGIAFTRDFAPEEIGRIAQVEATAAAVHRAMADAAIVDARDVHFVQIKCPLLTAAKIAEARSRGLGTATADAYESMAWSRGASAIGVALATGEVDREVIGDDAVMRDGALHSSVASSSAGIELEHNVVIVMGMSAEASSAFSIAHDVMRDAIDAAAVRRVLATLGINGDAAAARIVNVFAKAEAAPGGTVRGARHTMLNDSDINATRHARGAVGGVIASVVGQTAIYVSGGAEHQGPPGGGPVAVIVREW